VKHDRSAATMQTLGQLPTNTFSRAYKSGIKAAAAGKPITDCRCTNIFAIADWRVGWKDFAAAEQRVQGACMHPEKREIEGELYCWQCGVNVTPSR